MSSEPILEATSAKAMGNSTILVEFSDSTKRLVDMSRYFDLPVFKPLKDSSLFSDFELRDGLVTWMDGEIDIAPEAMRRDGLPVS